MELMLDNGAYIADSRGALCQVSGDGEILQRAMMRLRARRGGFEPMPEYGSRLRELLSSVKPSERQSAARQYVAEAIADEEELELLGVELTESGGEARVSVQLQKRDGSPLYLELTV